MSADFSDVQLLHILILCSNLYGLIPRIVFSYVENVGLLLGCGCVRCYSEEKTTWAATHPQAALH